MCNIKTPLTNIGCFYYALATGFKPVVFSVTGRRVNRATPSEQVAVLVYRFYPKNQQRVR